jgi:hypothetical protein
MAFNRYLLSARCALHVFGEAPASYRERTASDDHISTFRAVCVLAVVSGNISCVNVPQPGVLCGSDPTFDDPDGGRGHVYQLVAWVESEDVEWRIWAEVGLYP